MSDKVGFDQISWAGLKVASHIGVTPGEVELRNGIAWVHPTTYVKIKRDMEGKTKIEDSSNADAMGKLFSTLVKGVMDEPATTTETK